MTPSRPDVPGGTRVCPHCRQTILASAAVCPVCHHHLRAGEATVGLAARPERGVSLLRVEGTVAQAPTAAVCEYSIMVSVYSDDGTELTRQVVGVGALRPNETRAFDVSVEAYAVPTRG